MAMIKPTRFGLKYAPIPTLALEYEENLGALQDDDGTRSLYVLKETRDGVPKVRKKLHVVELPQLTSRSELLAVVQQLQRDNQRFLGPSVVREQQLQRLLQRLVNHLGGTTEELPPVDAQLASAATEQHDESEEMEASAMEESIAEAPASMEASRADEEEPSPPPMMKSSGGGRFITQEASDIEDEDETTATPDSTRQPEPVKQEPSEEELREAEEDEKKKKTLKNESDASDEEDVQSEELEYFSEDGSDEDSF